VKEWMRANSVWFRREKKAPSTPGLLKETAAVAAITKCMKIQVLITKPCEVAIGIHAVSPSVWSYRYQLIW